MFTLPGLLALVVAYYTRVHEIVEWLRPLPIMNLLYLMACFGLLLDVRLGLARTEASNHLKVVLPLWAWTLTSVALNGGDFVHQIIMTMVYMLPVMVIVQGVQTFRSLRLVTLVILATTVFIGVVGFIQARSPFECIRLSAESSAAGRPDGRTCESASQCREEAEPWEDFICERPGPLHTNSVGHGRIRFLGILEDPNEFALVMVLALPFAMIVVAQHTSLLSVLLLIMVLAVTVPVVIWTSSRTGQMAFIAVVGVYVLKGRGWKGLLVTAALAAPVLLLGGRSGEEAGQSAGERLEAWGVGIDLLKSSPLWGIGKSKFLDHHFITAHNTLVLESAELGIVGVWLWIGVLFLNFKILLSALRRYRAQPEPSLPCIWARALLACMCGLVVGLSFLSLGYHPVIWVYLALPGAYYFAVRRHDPDFHVGFGMRDLIISAGFAIVYLAGLKVYLMARGI